jgi:hypothetical protein
MDQVLIMVAETEEVGNICDEDNLSYFPPQLFMLLSPEK